MIEHVINLSEERFPTPWRSMDGQQGEPSHAGYLLASCEKHRNFTVRLFHDGYNKREVETERDRLVRLHSGNPKILYRRIAGQDPEVD